MKTLFLQFHAHVAYFSAQKLFVQWIAKIANTE